MDKLVFAVQIYKLGNMFEFSINEQYMQALWHIFKDCEESLFKRMVNDILKKESEMPPIFYLINAYNGIEKFDLDKKYVITDFGIIKK